jgi:NADH-quinone oxidoreductase subunit N
MTPTDYRAFLSSADTAAVMPIIITTLGALLVLFIDLLMPKTAPRRTIAVVVAAVVLVAGGVVELGLYGAPRSVFSGAFVVSGFSVAFSEIVFIATLISLLLTAGIGRSDQVPGTTALVLWGASGALLMAGAANLLTIFLGLELLSLALYCLCGFSERREARESALKYLILSSMASGFMLYGMALLFGATGSVALTAFATAAPTPLFILGTGLFLVGIAFKLSLVPFHSWTPDVYEGAPLAVTAFMSVVTKAGTLAVLARFAYASLPPAFAERILVPIWIVAAISMIVGNLAALAQTDMKRLLAYSGIAQIGYIVASLAGQTDNGMRYAIFYLGAYTFMNLGAFAVTALVARDGEAGAKLPAFAGLAQRRPLLAWAMTFFLLALAGLPPTAGFTGKILILASSVSAGYAWLAAILILGTAISLYVYFKIVRMMFARVDLGHVRDDRGTTTLPWVAVTVCAAATIVLGLYPFAPSAVLPNLR